MSRWIDADAIAEQIKDFLLPTSLMLNDIVQRKIEEAPSIDIVCCNECKHKEKCTMVAHHLTVGKGIKFVPITYCSAGERQTERSE